MIEHGNVHVHLKNVHIFIIEAPHYGKVLIHYLSYGAFQGRHFEMGNGLIIENRNMAWWGKLFLHMDELMWWTSMKTHWRMWANHHICMIYDEWTIWGEFCW
mgnify:CR=1 FL=1